VPDAGEFVRGKEEMLAFGFDKSWLDFARATVVIVVLSLALVVGPSAAQAPTYDTAFLTDDQLVNVDSMTEAEIRAFLGSRNSYFYGEISDVDGEIFDAATVIAQAAQRYGINPQVLLATLEKESSGVSRATRPADATLAFLMGCVKPSTAREQLMCAAEMFHAYHNDLNNRGVTTSGWRVGQAKTTVDGVSVTPATKAVAGQFTYTPYAGVRWGGSQPQVGGVHLFYDAWQKFGFGKAEPLPLPIDKDDAPLASATVLLIDVSGSMQQTWQGGVKLVSAQDAALSVIDMIEQESRVGETDHRIAVAVFESEAQLLIPPTKAYDEVRQVIQGLVPLDMTNMGAGLDTSNRALEMIPAGTPKIVVMLSDGLTNEGMSPAQILAGPVHQAAEMGTCIYTVGFGNPQDLDEMLLRNIARDSGCGQYAYASAPSELERIYIRLRHQSLGTVLSEFRGEIAQDETVSIGTVDVPPGQGELYATLHWPGSDLALVVEDPRGRVVDETYAGADFVKYARMIYLIIENPRQGAWQLQASGLDVPAGILEYDAIVSVRERVGPPPVNWGLAIGLLLLSVGIGMGIVFVAIGRSGAHRSPQMGIAVVDGQAARRFVPLRRRPIMIGRSSICDLVLADPQVSARHAVVHPTGQGALIQDLRSRNGTFVNGQRVQQASLRGDEHLRIGQTRLRYAMSEISWHTDDDSMSDTDAPVAYLAVLSGDGQEFRRYAIAPNAVLGRYSGCPVDLEADALVSQRHAQIGCYEGRWYIVDLGSRNRTLVNEAPIDSVWLHDGDVVRLGNTRMCFRV
jgi:pSer/pThr/pTyr-binding forkhead associated (FHA) protein